MDRVDVMEKVWTAAQCYGTHSMLKRGLNRPLMRKIFDKLDEWEGRISNLLFGSATDENEAKFPIKMMQKGSNEEVVYLSRNRKETMRSKMVIDKISDMKMNLGNKVTLRKTEKTKMDSDPPTQLNESKSKGSLVWGKAMTDCMAYPKR